MSDPTPNIIASWVDSHCKNTSFLSLQDVIIDVLNIKMQGSSQETIAEIAEKVEPDVLKALHEIADEGIVDGIEPKYILDSEASTNYIKFIEQTEFDSFLQTLREGSPENFESFCVKILNALGADAVRVGSSHDGGIDFEAFDLPLSHIDGPRPSGAKALVIGQAKRYAVDNFISERDIREFVGAVIKRSFLLKTKNSNKVGIIHPTAFAFWTTSDFHRNAKKFAKEMGIWYLNGYALVQLATKLNLNKE